MKNKNRILTAKVPEKKPIYELHDYVLCESTPNESKGVDSDIMATALWIVFGICCVILIAAAFWGYRKHDDYVARCSELTTAYNTGHDGEVQYYTHDGIVMARQRYWTEYEFEIDGEKRTVGFAAATPIKYDGLLDVYYNPEDTSEWYADGSVFDNWFSEVTGNWLNNPGDIGSPIK